MSLKTDFQDKEYLINQAYLMTNTLLSNDINTLLHYNPNNYDHKNQWKFKRYNGQKTAGYTPTLSDVTNKTPSSTTYLTDGSDRYDYKVGDYYIGEKECWVLCKYAYNWSTSFTTDDNGAFYLNGSLVKTSTSCASTSITIPFKAGINHIQLLYYEHAGGDYGYINATLNSQSFVRWLYGNYLR